MTKESVALPLCHTACDGAQRPAKEKVEKHSLRQPFRSGLQSPNTWSKQVTTALEGIEWIVFVALMLWFSSRGGSDTAPPRGHWATSGDILGD